MAGVDALVSFAVKNLGTLLVEEAVFLGSVRGKVDDMRRELTRMQCFLVDADRRRVQGDASVINWLVEIRDLAYDADEVVATFEVKVVGRRHSVPVPVRFDFNKYFRCVKTCLPRRGVGKDIEEINSKIAGLTRSLQTYGVQPTAALTRPRTTYYTAVEENVVGLRDHVTTVVAHLKDKTHPRIISIWGIGGLGKTTFSKQIKRHAEIAHYFDHVAWVCVSQQCNPHQVWTDILLQFVHQPEEKAEVRSMKSDELARKLDSFQMEKKCLVILDDIWKQEDWTSLRGAFPTATGSGSKIMLTTRNKEVVTHSDIQSFSFNLPFLTTEECLELLEKKLSPGAQGFGMSTEMKNIIEEIVGHCGGLPLAIVLIGGLLAKDKTLDGWEKVRRDLNNSLNKGNDLNGGVQDVLALSYQDLPYYLKSCLLYFSLFPEDHVIQAKPLVQMWIAEGFVSVATGELGSKTLLDVGLSYLNELVNRCMVQADIRQFTKRVKSCRLHDLMRDFCQSMAREEKFSEDLNLKHSVASTAGASSSSKIRRLAVYLNDDQQQQAAIIPRGQHQHVRSCLVHNLRNSDDVAYYCDKVNSLLMGFKVLKVFSLVGTSSDFAKGKLSKDIRKLNHLRYLCTRHAICLPSSLGELVLLQTLDIRMSYSFEMEIEGRVMVPDILWKLKGLIHLYLPGGGNGPTKLRLDGLSKLETLVNFDTSVSDVRDLSTLPSLRKIHIKHCTYKDLANISEYPVFSKSTGLLQRSSFRIVGNAETQEEHSLLCRVLAYPHVTKFSLDGTVYEETFLDNLSKNITSIDLLNCGLKEDPMPALGELPHLRTLTLSKGSYIGKKLVCQAPKKKTTSTLSFPQLTTLSILNLNISEWKVEEGTMPSLSTLDIYNCTKLLQIPDGLKFIATLQTLEVWGASESFTQRLEERGEDFHIIQHIPDRSIY